MTDWTKRRDEAAKDKAMFCWCAGSTCSGCEATTTKLFSFGLDAGRDDAIMEVVEWLQTKQPGESALNAACYQIAGDELKERFLR